MLRAVCSAAMVGGRSAATALLRQPTTTTASASVAPILNTVAKRWSGGMLELHESPDEFDQRFLDFFNQPDIDGWEIRRGMTELHAHDVIPEPKIVTAALRACRRVNDYALAVRFLEAIKMKCGGKADNPVYAYVLKEVKPALEELGVSTPEQMGYDKPELFHPQPEYWWEHKWYDEYGYKKEHGYQF